MSLSAPHHSLLTTFSLALLLGLATWSFSAGLGGILIFDDIPNFLPWQNIGDINSLKHIFTFTFSGISLPGRPLSLLSFLIDDQSWPPDVYSLKRTNLAIHLVNSCLIFWLTLKLLPRLLPSKQQHSTWLALLVTAIWSLHPLQVSNVSYIIQRMNLLSTLLELAGLLLFVYGRNQLTNSPKRALIICSIAVGFFMPMAILAKENGLLLCAFVLLTEAFCFPKSSLGFWRIWKALFLWLPLLVFLAYILIAFKGFTISYPNRDFNSWERMLTQGPVIVDYLNKLLLPRLQGSGLYFDNFPVSRSLINPLNTLFSWIILLGLITSAWRLRHRLPLFSFGILFYFTGHLMESTLIPLELYFEHRNYFPQWGLWLSLIGLLPLLPNTLSPSFKKIGIILTLVVVALLATITRNSSALWSDSKKQTIVWYQENPDSLRNTLEYSNLLLLQGKLDEAQTILKKGELANSTTLILPISKLYVQCYWQGKATNFSILLPIANKAQYDNASLTMLEQMQKLQNNDLTFSLHDNNCTPPSQEFITNIYHAILNNPHYNQPQVHEYIHERLAEIASKKADLDEAMSEYSIAFEQRKNPIYPYRQALLLESAGLHKDSLSFLRKSENALNIRYRIFYPDLKDRIQLLREKLEINEP